MIGGVNRGEIVVPLYCIFLKINSIFTGNERKWKEKTKKRKEKSPIQRKLEKR